MFKQKEDLKDGKIVGTLVSTGIRPSFYERFEAYGIDVPASIFNIEEW
ncbi:hypothetical protein [Clostridium sp.]|nr:hypothetical protein [Clostridium sp.]MBK5242840.1 hypothetical protein [Clostridium sp.]